MIREPDPKTQNGRVLAYIRTHPGATFVECYDAMQPRIANIRARHSDLRLIFGIEVVCEPRPDGNEGFSVYLHPVQRELGLTG